MASYEDLESKVINTDICTVCGACILACPNSHVKFIEGKPKRSKRAMDCVGCSTCYEACYMLRHDLIRNIEDSILGWGKKDSVGIYKRIVAARTREQNIKKACQDGGIVTTLLIYALGKSIIDGALVVGSDSWMPIASIAKTRDEVILAAGTKYGVVPVLKELRSAVIDHGLSKICVVGSPCHIQSVRYLKHKGLPLASSVKLTVGLFCRENYYYQRMMEKVSEKGLSVEQIDKLNVAEEFNVYAGGKELSFPITEIKSCVPKHCLICEDFAGELADISIGSDGSPEGWSTIIIRTEEGESVFSGLEREGLVETKSADNLVYIKKIAHRKREKGKQTQDIFKLKEEGLGNKEIAARLGITEERVSHRLEGL
jgi:coenzyme F420 hydrogenase subunit beta